jgi:hypothetical protein
MGSGRELFVLNPFPRDSKLVRQSSWPTSDESRFGGWTVQLSFTSEKHLTFFGSFIGIAIRTRVPLPLSMSPLFWKALCGQEVMEEDLECTDKPLLNALDALGQEAGRVLSTLAASIGMQVDVSQGQGQALAALEEAGRSDPDILEALNSPVEGFDGFNWTRVPGLCLPVRPGISLDSPEKAVTLRDVASGEFRAVVIDAKLHEVDSAMLPLRQGFLSVIPAACMPLFTWRELENIVCGNRSAIDIDLLEDNCEYDEGILPSDPHVQALWATLRDLSQEDLRAFLRFTWARSRLPAERVWTQKFKIQGVALGMRDEVVIAQPIPLPQSQSGSPSHGSGVTRSIQPSTAVAATETASSNHTAEEQSTSGALAAVADIPTFPSLSVASASDTSAVAAPLSDAPLGHVALISADAGVWTGIRRPSSALRTVNVPTPTGGAFFGFPGVSAVSVGSGLPSPFPGAGIAPVTFPSSSSSGNAGILPGASRSRPLTALSEASDTNASRFPDGGSRAGSARMRREPLAAPSVPDPSTVISSSARSFLEMVARRPQSASVRPSTGFAAGSSTEALGFRGVTASTTAGSIGSLLRVGSARRGPTLPDSRSFGGSMRDLNFSGSSNALHTLVSGGAHSNGVPSPAVFLGGISPLNVPGDRFTDSPSAPQHAGGSGSSPTTDVLFSLPRVSSLLSDRPESDGGTLHLEITGVALGYAPASTPPPGHRHDFSAVDNMGPLTQAVNTPSASPWAAGHADPSVIDMASGLLTVTSAEEVVLNAFSGTGSRVSALNRFPITAETITNASISHSLAPPSPAVCSGVSSTDGSPSHGLTSGAENTGHQRQPNISPALQVEIDKQLPTASTCFFSLHLPRYSSASVLKDRLLYAIHNCVLMDGDYRLSTAAGWEFDGTGHA